MHAKVIGPATKRQLIQSPVKHLAWALLRYTDRGDDLGRAIGNAVEAEVEVLLLTASVVASVLALAAGRRAPLGYEGPQER